MGGSNFAVGYQGGALKSPSAILGDGVSLNGKTLVVSRAGAVIDGVDLRGYTVEVHASNVTVKNSLFNASGFHTIYQTGSASGLVVEYNTFDGQKANNANSDIIYSDKGAATIRNNEFFNLPSDAINTVGGTIEKNYFSGAGYQSGAHADAISIHSTTGPVVIRQNYIDYTTPADAAVPDTNAAIKIVPHFGNINDVTVDGNVLMGGGYTIYAMNAEHAAANIKITNNDIGLGHWGDLYPAAKPSGFAYSGNEGFATAQDQPVSGAATAEQAPTTPSAATAEQVPTTPSADGSTTNAGDAAQPATDEAAPPSDAGQVPATASGETTGSTPVTDHPATETQAAGEAPSTPSTTDASDAPATNSTEPTDQTTKPSAADQGPAASSGDTAGSAPATDHPATETQTAESSEPAQNTAVPSPAPDTGSADSTEPSKGAATPSTDADKAPNVETGSDQAKGEQPARDASRDFHTAGDGGDANHGPSGQGGDGAFAFAPDGDAAARDAASQGVGDDDTDRGSIGANFKSVGDDAFSWHDFADKADALRSYLDGLKSLSAESGIKDAHADFHAQIDHLKEKVALIVSDFDL
jgi:hypothetical protein